LDHITTILLGLLGLFSGCLEGMLRVRGGVIVVPILILVFRLDARLAVGTSLVMVIFTALSATAAYHRQKRIDWKIGFLAATAAVPGAAIGAYLTKFFTSRGLAIIFGFTLFLLAALMLRRSFRTTTSPTRDATKDMLSEPSKGAGRRRIVDTTGKVFEYDARLRSGLLPLFFGGLASGFLGIGGGLIVVPIPTAVVELPMHLAVATSMLTMIFTSISGVSTHIMLGNVAVEYALPLAVGILLGAQLGARAARHLRCATLERLCCSGLGNGSSTHHHSVVEGVTVPLSPAGLPGSL